MSPGMTLLDGWANADFSGIGETVEDEYGGTVKIAKEKWNFRIPSGLLLARTR